MRGFICKVQRVPVWLLVLLLGGATSLGGGAALAELRDRQTLEVALPTLNWPAWPSWKASSNAAPPTATPEPTPCRRTQAQVVGVGEVPLRVRARPGLREEIVARLPEGALLQRGCALLLVDKITWAPVYGEGWSGWASAAYLETLE